MTVDSGPALALATTITLGLLISAVGAPLLLRRAAPALMHRPRTAAHLLTAGMTLWTLATIVLGPLYAWALAGPRLLGHTPESCGRCSTGPVDGPFVTETPTAAIALLVGSALAGSALVLSMARAGRRRSRATRRTSARLRARGTAIRLHGHDVVMVDDQRPFAVALPGRHGGIVLSTGARGVLDQRELAAVLAHEAAHLTQWHHLIGGFAALLARPLRAVPLIAAAADAIPHYLEIAADDEAKASVGTPALAAALLRLGEPVALPVPEVGEVHALHAAGPQRIRHLVCPDDPVPAARPAVLLTAGVIALAFAGAAAPMPYVGMAVLGCA
ncbi:Peptidase family M48 [Austwickia chelonae]|uniref:Peptidase M48 domain-containing protein n=1 Tax=Austwickia chelonae NBRC 105200 TaxID=1184607 RepID=K6VQ37_9MICO|nr:M56 family metallopeptidase [Austwickia chelonae]GAB78869.1 hypothetical protein AUCHE_17_00810 [Austwickia chelonae NBRC 105200]SEV85615.1 Peptidase family M48 [Austwickia chelonae]